MAKHGIAAIAEGRTDLFRMDPSKIVVREGWNSRDFDHPDNQAHVDAMAASIREVGVKEPLAGYLEGETFVLTNGESRYRAVQKLLTEGVEIKTVPVMPEPRYSSEADYLASQFIRNSGRPFTPMENAKLFTKLLALGWSEKDISEKTGVTVERVQQVSKLNAVPESVKGYIRKGQVSATLVQRIQAKAKDAKEIETQVKDAIAAAKAEGKTKATPKHAAPKKPKAEKPETEAAPRTNYRELFEELMSYVISTEDESSDKTTEVVASLPKDRWKLMEDAAKTQGRF